jgi:methyl-accepting chemotaxis protein
MASNTQLPGEAQKEIGADLAAKIALYEAAFNKAEAVCSEAARGNLEARVTEIDTFGEIGSMLWAINRMLDLTDAFVREAGTSLTYASEGKFFRRFVLRGMLGDFRRGAMTINTAREDMEKKARDAAVAGAKSKQRLEIAEDFGSKVGVVVQAVSGAAAEMEATANEMAKLAGNAHQQSLAVSAAAETAWLC